MFREANQASPGGYFKLYARRHREYNLCVNHTISIINTNTVGDTILALSNDVMTE